MTRNGVAWCGVFIGLLLRLHAAEVIENPADDEWDKEVKAESKAAEEDFATWKTTGKLPESFEEHAIRGAREDLVQRHFSGDMLAATEIKTELLAKDYEVTVRDTELIESSIKESSPHSTVWRRITRDRFEIWTPTTGKLYDAKGKLIAKAKVHRGDGWGREWYGAFLPDGCWITTDIDELDKEVTAFSAKGKLLWSVKGATLIPKSKNPDSMDSLSLIAWARANKEGNAWIVSVGSEHGRGFVKLTPGGKWEKIDDPWLECFPQQLRSRGMYTDRYTVSDNGSLSVNRVEAGHGMHVGWPHYHFLDTDILIPNGDDFGILPESWSVFIESDCGPFTQATEDRKDERTWFFDAKGIYQHWIHGRTVGASLPSGGMWIRQLDDSCSLVEKGHTIKFCMKFSTKDHKSLIPVELHDDIGLGLFLLSDELVLGTWGK